MAYSEVEKELERRNVMKKVFDVLEEIRESAAEFFYGNEWKPESVSLSPGDYRRMLEVVGSMIAADDGFVGIPLIHEIATPFGSIRVIIDESLSDTDLRMA
jgi:hypothetical protein